MCYIFIICLRSCRFTHLPSAGGSKNKQRESLLVHWLLLTASTYVMQLVLTPQLLPLAYPHLCTSFFEGAGWHDFVQEEDTVDELSPKTLAILRLDEESSNEGVTPHPSPLPHLDHKPHTPPPSSALRHPRKVRSPHPLSISIPSRFPIPKSLSTTSLSTITAYITKLSVHATQSTILLSAILTDPTGALSTTLLATGPTGYVYTPVSARVPEYESLRDNHGITFTQKRHVVGKALMRWGAMNDGDARGGRGVREGIMGWLEGRRKFKGRVGRV
ncbi:hypothetical protein DE146DRAFT_522033 [Phaeosphaeria sp. MPI-PUGE-AT-0046c]|nr:hypothetical protein DE146DRAFT_522033 [Phaeosphaeria sp. MPI-PUGE-AT-0046c]